MIKQNLIAHMKRNVKYPITSVNKILSQMHNMPNQLNSATDKVFSQNKPQKKNKMAVHMNANLKTVT